MPLTIPVELKKITQFVRRAEELDRDAKNNPESRVVAYYCRQHAVQTGIPLAQSSSSAAAKECLGELLGELEREKAAMSVFSPAESQLICERFAEQVFQKANTQDQAGMANKDTAKTFYAAATFLEILHQFLNSETSENEPEEQNQKRIFCKWKSTEILKALKEGRTPTPGGYEPEEEEEPESITAPEPEEPDIYIPLPPQRERELELELELPPPPMEMEMKMGSYQEEEGTEVDLLGPPPAYAPTSLDDAPVVDFSPPVVMAPPPVVVQPTAPSSATGLFGRMRHNNKTNGNKATKAQLADATELTTFALTAFKSGDAELGATRLQEALAALGR